MTIKFTQITCNENTLYGLDQYGRIWWIGISMGTGWILINNPKENNEREDD